MEEVYIVECLHPTKTVSKGSNYVVINDDGHLVTIINDDGNKVLMQRKRFGELQVENVNNMTKIEKVKCINAKNFKSIKTGKEYSLVKESKDFFYIKNEINKTARYNKKYFEIKEEKPKVAKEKKPAKPKKVENIAVCVYPVRDQLTFKKEYKYKKAESKDGEKIKVTCDDGVERVCLKKRFEIKKQ